MAEEGGTFRTQLIYGGVSDPPPSILFTESRRLAVSRTSGFVSTRLKMIEGTDLRIGSVLSTGHLIELREADRLTILLPRSGRLRVRIGGAEHGVTPDDPMAFVAGERTTEAIAGRSGEFAATTLQVPINRMVALAEKAGIPLRSVRGPDALALRGRIGDTVLHGMNRLADDIFVLPEVPLPPRVAAAIANMIDEQLVALMDGQGLTTHPRVLPAFHRVRAAEEIIHADSDEPLSMIDIAQRLRVSLRSLQLAFAEVHDGKSPRQIYNQIRLQRARQRLLDASGRDQVTAIALDTGFIHLSRFAQSYARTFGELPSETLARRRCA
jgi:AraC-like DNA-binding protein